jgi:hypothetical protein
MPKQDNVEIFNPGMVRCTGRVATVNGYKMTRYDCDVTSSDGSKKHVIKNIGEVEFKSVPYTANPPVMDWSTMKTGADGKPFISVKVSNYAQCRATGSSEDGKSWRYLLCFVPEEKQNK